MSPIRRVIDLLSLGSATPVRRLASYYIVLIAIIVAGAYLSPAMAAMLTGAGTGPATDGPLLLRDGLQQAEPAIANPIGWLAFGLNTTFLFLSTLALMLPVTWVYMSATPGRRYNQSIVHTLIVLPMVVAGIVFVVQNSLALAFSLAGVVAAVRFRTTLNETRDIVFVFLAIAVGFAAGVNQTLAALYLSMMFNFVLLFIWRFDFGRNVLEPNAAAEWVAPLATLSERTANGYSVPDRDLVLALTPKKVDVLSHRFERLRKRLGSNGKQPKYNAVVTILAADIAQAQRQVERALDQATKRWKLDEVVTNTGKPSELYFLVRTRRSVTRDALLTEIRSYADGSITSADIEIGEALAVEKSEEHVQKKLEQTRVLEQK